MFNQLFPTLDINAFSGSIIIPEEFVSGIHPIYRVCKCTPHDIHRLKFYKYPEVPFCDIDALKSLMNEVFASIEGIRKAEYCEDRCEWNIEYGTTPFIKSLPYQDHRSYKAVSWFAIKAAMKAREMFPHLDVYDDNDYDYYGGNYFEKFMWSKSVARIYLHEDKNPSLNCEKKDKLFISWDRLDGCSISSYFIKNSLKEKVTIGNILWKVRVNYLSFIDGCGYSEDGDFMHFDVEPYKHIIRYVTNPMLAREICTFMG